MFPETSRYVLGVLSFSGFKAILREVLRCGCKQFLIWDIWGEAQGPTLTGATGDWIEVVVRVTSAGEICPESTES